MPAVDVTAPGQPSGLRCALNRTGGRESSLGCKGRNGKGCAALCPLTPPGRPGPCSGPHTSPFKSTAGVLLAWRSPPQGTDVPWHSPFQPKASHTAAAGQARPRGSEVLPSRQVMQAGDHVPCLSTGQLAAGTAMAGALPQPSGTQWGSSGVPAGYGAALGVGRLYGESGAWV